VSPRALRRLRVHLAFAAVVVVVCVAFRWIAPRRDVRSWLSLASAYTALGLMAGTLVIGPCHVLTRRAVPTSFDLRRDVGIWAGALALFHTVVGLTVHMRGRMWKYFLHALDPPRMRWDLFGLANHSGLLAGLLLVGLLALSNDLSLRRLGTSRWKALQRWTYVAFVLMVVHGVLYQTVEKRALAGWVILLAVAAATAILQIAAARRVFSRSRAAVFVASTSTGRG